MHYRHSYHAGNFADVFKHLAVCGLLDALSRKDSAWCFVDTHAGAGSYDLGGASAAATAEWRDGIARLSASPESMAMAGAPALLARYLALVRDYGGAEPRAYPGSPLLAAAVARPQDRLLLCERVPEVADELRQTLGRRATVHVRDGYEAASLLPPAEKRGLVLIDPPFERSDEYEAMADFIIASALRFAGGIYAAWYPIKNEHVAGRFRRRVARETGKPTLDLRLDVGVAERAAGSVRADSERQAKQAHAAGARIHVFSPRKAQTVVKVRMHACGLLIVNPPFGFEAQAREALAFLTPHLAQGARASWQVEPVQA
ncbi:MAG: rRNA ((2030)-N(6))-methyltransferase RlmJ [Nevskia sp.]|nr:rRNA ((2030)-N(6))-methyltransferase RlmJ [Nevskia sp.]